MHLLTNLLWHYILDSGLLISVGHLWHLIKTGFNVKLLKFFFILHFQKTFI